MNYRKECKIGNGSYGKVYKAIREDGLPFAVKVNLCNKQFSFSYSIKEMDICVLLSHATVIRICTILMNNPFNKDTVSPLTDSEHKKLRIDCVHFVYPLASCDLLEFVSNGTIKTLQRDQVDKLMFEMLSALEYIHSKNIIHRDIKINNFLVFVKNNKYSCKMTDFGLAKRYLPNEPISPTLTLHYFRSPECAEGYASSFKSDVWGMACIFYEMLAGKVPFATKDGDDINSDEELLDCINSRVSEQFCSSIFPEDLGRRKSDMSTLMRKMFEIDPSKRWSASQCLGKSVV